MGDFDPPPGDPGAIRTAATNLGALSTDLHGRSTAVTKASSTAITDWKGPRATDFRRAALTVQDEVAQAESVMQQAAAALSTYATALATAQSAVATATTSVDNATTAADEQIRKDPDNAIDYHRGAAATADKAANDAGDAQHDARVAAQQLAATLDQLTGLIVAKGTKLDASSITRAVNDTMGGGPMPNGPLSADACWAMFGTVDAKVFTNAPKPNDPAFAAWFASLTPLQRELASQSLNSQFDPQGFNPYSTIKPGELPPWAKSFNAKYATQCTVAMPEGQGPYGYFGGGTVMGPGGVPWPIVMPYVAEGNHVYMGEDGPIGADGGINQLDGKDGGWSTVAQYTGVSQYGTVKGSTKLIVVGEILTGQELEVNETDPDAVQVDANGRPYAGGDAGHVPSGGPPDKAYWDVSAPTNERDEISRGSSALGVQALQAAGAQHALNSHAQRRYFIDYQVNADGRTRAVMHTYTTTRNEEGKTIVGSFANGFPDGNDSTNELAYNTRHNPQTQPMSSAAPDPNVEYTGHDDEDPIDNSTPINDPLHR